MLRIMRVREGVLAHVTLLRMRAGTCYGDEVHHDAMRERVGTPYDADDDVESGQMMR